MKSGIKKVSIISSIIVLFLLTGIFSLHINKENILNPSSDVAKFAFGESSSMYENLEEEIVDDTNCQYDTIENGNIIINEYYGDKESVIIPNEINETKIEKIAENAFYYNNNLEIIKVPIEIAQNNVEINGFSRAEELSNEYYVVYKTTNAYTDIFLRYRNLSDEEKMEVESVPRKFIENRKMLIPQLDELEIETEESEETNEVETQTNGMVAYASSSAKATSLPSKFDLRTRIRIGVENQEELGICYAYATNKSLETNIALNYRNNVNFSEVDMAMKSRELCGGGFLAVNAKYLMTGLGPIREKSGTILNKDYVKSRRYNDTYSNTIWNACVVPRANERTTSLEEQTISRLANIGGTPEYYAICSCGFNYIDVNTKRTNPTKVAQNRNQLKQCIMQYGSAYTFVMMDESRYKYYNGKMVMNCRGNETTGAHAVSIIGWDDNFSKNNFPTSLGVTQNGAWLVLNSWGDKWGNGDGTFWVSYQDAFVENDNYIVIDVSQGKVNVSNASKVRITVPNVEYNGSPKTPQVKVEYLSNVNQYCPLTKDVDYTIKYSNNINAGTATVTITGIGRFTGTVNKTFTIAPKNINIATVTVSPTAYAYNGMPQQPTVTVRDGNKTLMLNTDYTVSYSNNVDVGTATATITGKGNYTGSINKTFTIRPENINVAAITILPMSYPYDGLAKQPTTTVRIRK